MVLKLYFCGEERDALPSVSSYLAYYGFLNIPLIVFDKCYAIKNRYITPLFGIPCNEEGDQSKECSQLKILVIFIVGLLPVILSWPLILLFVWGWFFCKGLGVYLLLVVFFAKVLVSICYWLGF